MTESKSIRRAARQATKKSTGTTFTADEQEAMRDRASEQRAAARRTKGAAKVDGEAAVLDKIEQMPESDRTIATRLHAIITATAPDLSPRTWYGMPAYATAGKNGKVVCFFQSSQKFKTRYATLGFSDKANLDSGAMWPTAFALKELTPAEEETIRALVKQAVG